MATFRRPSFYIWRTPRYDTDLIREVHCAAVQSGTGQNRAESDQGAGFGTMPEVRSEYESAAPDRQSVRYQDSNSLGMYGLRLLRMEAVRKRKATGRGQSATLTAVLLGLGQYEVVL